MKKPDLTLRKRRYSPMERTRNRSGLIFILPSFILCALFMLWPLFEVIRYSFTDWNGVAPTYNYVWFENYKAISQIDGYKEMMIATVTFALGTTILTIVISFMTALALDKKGKGYLPRGLMRSLWFLPALLSGTVVGMLWRIMYNYNNGVINKLFMF